MSSTKIFCYVFSMLAACTTVYCTESAHTVSPSSQDNGANDLQKQNNWAPFTKAQSNIPSEAVSAIHISDKGIVLFSTDMQYSEQSTKIDEAFANALYLDKFQKLNCLTLYQVQLTDNIQNALHCVQDRVTELIITLPDMKEDETIVSRLSETLKGFRSLKALSIFAPQCNKKQTAEIIGAISNLKNLKQLHLSFGTINGESCKELSQIIANSTQVSNSTEEPNSLAKGSSSPKSSLLGFTLLLGEIVDDEGYANASELMKSISGAIKLKTIKMGLYHLPIEIADLFFSIPKDMKNLRTVRWYAGNLAQMDETKVFTFAEKFRDSLEDLDDITNLDISQMNLPSQAMQPLLKMIANFGKLTYLDVSGNNIDEQGAELFTQSIVNLEHLNTLLMRRCNIDSKIIATLCKNMKDAYIQYLYFGDNSIKEGCTSIPVDVMPYLVLLDLSNNGITFNSAFKLVESTKTSPKLKVINFKGNEMEREDNTQRTIHRDSLNKWQLQNGKQIVFSGF